MTLVFNGYVTQFTKTGNLNMVNRKPFRTKFQKKMARETAYKAKDGAWRSDADVSYHTHAQDRGT